MSDFPCVEDRLLSGPTVDRLLDSCRSRKYALMKRPFDPFPAPLRIGRSSRWLASLVFAWIARQVIDVECGNRMSDIHLEGFGSKGAPSSLCIVFDIQRMKQRYEAGFALDQICREFRIGKARLAEALRAAGTQIRKPGRSRSISADCAETASVLACRTSDPFGRSPASSEALHGY